MQQRAVAIGLAAAAATTTTTKGPSTHHARTCGRHVVSASFSTSSSSTRSGAMRCLASAGVSAAPLWSSLAGRTRSYGRDTASDSASSAYAQFQSQQGAYHRHSFHEKGHQPRGDGKPRSQAAEGGSDDHAGGADNAQQQQQQQQQQRSDDQSANGETGGEDWGYAGPESGYSRAEAFTRKAAGQSPSATAKERRDMSRSWENAFFGRVHFEQGMHDRFRQALDAEEHERIARKTNEELFPDWPPDEEAPPHLFRKLSPALQLRYVLNRLAMGERRVRYAADYGSLSMMYQLNLGEAMVSEAETLLVQLNWMNDELREKIDEVKAVAAKVKYDYDLD